METKIRTLFFLQYVNMVQSVYHIITISAEEGEESPCSDISPLWLCQEGLTLSGISVTSCHP